MVGIRFTRIPQTAQSKTGKAFYLKDGQLEKKPLGNLCNGVAKICDVKNAREFAQCLDSLSPGDSLVYGVPPENEVSIRTKAELQNIKAQGIDRDQEGRLFIARDQNHFSWSDGAGVMMLDYDPPDDTSPLSKVNLIDYIYDVSPELKNTSVVWKTSSSSFIYNQDTGEELAGLQGQRLYLFVDNAKEIPRLGRNLFSRLWLAGHGYIKLSSSGAILPRTLVDAAVWQPERLDFAGGAFCHSPLIQKRPPSEVIHA